MFRHEYGHTLQSRLVGPLYLSHIALPSLIGSGLDDIGLNDHSKEWYETQANRMSFRYFYNHASGALTTLPCDDTKYPREYLCTSTYTNDVVVIFLINKKHESEYNNCINPLVFFRL